MISAAAVVVSFLLTFTRRHVEEINISATVFMVALSINSIKMLHCPTNALNCVNFSVLKHIKNVKSSPKCFGSRRNHHQGAKVSV